MNGWVVSSEWKQKGSGEIGEFAEGAEAGINAEEAASQRNLRM